ncbi:MAG: sensor histidine kinase [Microbacteriaceae bacterium]|nr:sensor histidine kinase [Microbacteriaceae bacterium]
MTPSASIRAMRYGQHAITVVLFVIGVVRALGGDSSPVLVAVVGLCFSGWYVAGSIFAARAGSRRLAAIWLIGLALVWLGLVVISAEFIWLAFPLWLLAGHLLPLQVAVVFSVAVFAGVAVVPLLKTGMTGYEFIIGPLVGGVFAFAISRGYLQLLKDARERQQLIASLVQAQDEMTGLHEELGRVQRESGATQERTRLSRDIHDTIAQGFSAIVLLARASKDAAAALNALEQVETIALDNLVEARRIVGALAPAELDEGALTGALRRMLERLSTETGIQTELHSDASLPALPATVEVALLRTAQSALSNVRIHADARRVVVNLVDAEDAVRLDIVDDGRGFDTRAWCRKVAVPSGAGYGLHSMRARLRELGGGLDIESATGNGTALSAFVPLGVR